MDFQDEDGWGRPGFIVWAVGLGIMLVTAVCVYSYLPADARIPMQTNASGRPINFAEKGWVLFSPVVVAAGLALVLDVIPFMPRPKRNISAVGKYLGIGVFVFVQLMTAWMAFQWHS